MSLADIVTLVQSAGVARVYEENKVPVTPSYPYAVLGSSYGAPGAQTTDGHRHVTRWVTVRIFGKTAASLDAVAEDVDAALNGRSLPLPGSPVAEFLQANQTSRDADDSGVLGTVLIYRY